jgi:hypothetical protein
MATERARSRCRERVEELSGSAVDVDSLRREAIGILRSAIGFDRWCALLLDPDTLVASQGIGHNDFWTELPRLNINGAGLSDINSHTMLARSRDHVGLLSAATGGDLARSERWREILAPTGSATSSAAWSWTSSAPGATSGSSATATTRRSRPRTRG